MNSVKLADLVGRAFLPAAGLLPGVACSRSARTTYTVDAGQKPGGGQESPPHIEKVGEILDAGYTKATMRYYERRLPHFDVIGQPVFVTFRLHGSLPANRRFPPGSLTSGEAFVAMDRLLDEARQGPVYLRQVTVAELVTDSIREGHTRARYDLHAFVVMPNHVHMLVTPRISSAVWLRSLKGFTAHEANRILGTSGPFWQDESYDRVVRKTGEFRSIQRYIEFNPVKAGLTRNPEEFSWSSATPGRSPAAGRNACPTRD